MIGHKHPGNIEDKSKIIVGVNKFETTEVNDTPVLKIDGSIQKMETEKLRTLKQSRENVAIEKCLADLSLPLQELTMSCLLYWLL